ncbi:MAG TPA: sugar-binding protein [Cytophagaceae bacterium]|nr:sugar-binding protein [Cytophagaceae bacterium]
MIKYIIIFFLCTIGWFVAIAQKKEGDYKAHKTNETININGKGDEKEWEKAPWKKIKHTWLGANPEPQDFEGKYKMLWDENYIYYLVEIQDDSLSDQHRDPFNLWWEDDCLELFIDENNSKGIHQYNHTAFAYHITLHLDVVDMGPDKKPVLLNDHLIAMWTRKDSTHYIWEVAMRVYDDTYNQNSKTNKPVVLSKGKKLGFAVSYNDNDGNFKRENFIGSIPIEGEDKNRGWIDAGVFGTLELVK